MTGAIGSVVPTASSAVAAYLTDLKVPGPGSVCHPDVQPFPIPFRES